MVKLSTPFAFVVGALIASGTATASLGGALNRLGLGAGSFVDGWIFSWLVAFPLTLIFTLAIARLRGGPARRNEVRPSNTAGRLAPLAYLGRLCVVAVVFWGGWRGAEQLLPWLAKTLNPWGLNGGLALNALLLTLIAAFLFSVDYLATRRLADAGINRLYALLPALAFMLWAIVADWVFLWSRFLPLVAGAGTPADWTAGSIAVASAVCPALFNRAADALPVHRDKSAGMIESGPSAAAS